MRLFTKDIDKKLFAQYSLGADLEKQMVVAKIFNPYGRGCWYLLNSDPQDSDYLWAIVDLFEVETGSVSRSELESIKVPPFGLGLERDLYFTPVNAKVLYDGLLSGKHYAKGGQTSNDLSNLDPYDLRQEASELLLKLAEDIRYESILEDAMARSSEFENNTTRFFKNTLDICENAKKEFDIIKDKYYKRNYAEGGEMANGGEVKKSKIIEDSLKQGYFGIEKGSENIILKEKYGHNFNYDYIKQVIDTTIIKSFSNNDFYFNWLENRQREEYYKFFSELCTKFTNDIDGTLNKYFELKATASSRPDKLYVYKYNFDLAPFIEKSKTLPQDIKKSFQEYMKRGGKENKMADGGELDWGADLGNGITIGTDIYITDPKSMYKGRTGFITGVVGKDYMVTISIDGNDRNVLVSKKGFDRLDAPEYAKGGEIGEQESRKKLEELRSEKKLDFSIGNHGLVFMSLNNGFKKSYDNYKEAYEHYLKSKGSNHMAMGGKVDSSSFDELKKGDKIEITYGSGISKSNEVKLLVKSKNVVGKGKSWESEKITFQNIDKPNSVNYFAYKRKDGHIGFAIGNMAISNVHIKDTMAKGGEIMKHKHNENITIELIEPTSKGWKVKQIETHSIGDKKLSTPKEKIAYFSKDELKDLFESKMAMGGETTFEDKVKAVKTTLLKNKKVSPKVQKDYGKKYSPKEALASAKRIIGSRVAKSKK